MEDLEEEEEDDKDHDIFQKDKEDEEDFVDDGLYQHSFNNLYKAESILLQILTHIDSLDKGALDDKYFFDLLYIFEEKIINTVHSKHSQFVIFYICSKRSDYYPQKFMAYLLNKIIRPNCPLQYRISALSCLCSFSVRFSKIPSNIILECYDLLNKWAIDYLEKNTKNTHNEAPDLNSHSIFYSLCQSIIYIYIWKHNNLTFEHNFQELQSNFRKIIINPFHPLLVSYSPLFHSFLLISNSIILSNFFLFFHSS